MIAHRPATPADHRLVVKSWVASYRDSDSAGMVQVDDWYAVMVPQVTRALSRPDVETTIAYETTNDDPGSNAYGFIVADVTERPALVYYVYVKQAYRRSGIARGLFAAVGVDPERPFHFVCKTELVSTLERKIPCARYMPRLGRFPKSERKAR